MDKKKIEQQNVQSHHDKDKVPSLTPQLDYIKTYSFHQSFLKERGYLY